MGSRVDPDFSLHIVAIPFPGRGHINPLMNLCKIIATTRPEFLITFVVTEEWLGFLSSDDYAKPPVNVRFGAIPNVIPSELIRAKVYPEFLQAVYTEMEGPVDRLLDGLDPPAPSVIMYDVFLSWVVGIGSRRNIPVASFWTQSATMFSLAYHHQLLLANGHFDADLTEKGEEVVDYIPGVCPIHVKDLPPPLLFHAKVPVGLKDMRSLFLEAISLAQEAQYLVFTSIAHLESPVIEALRSKIKTPIYSIGTALPSLNIQAEKTRPDYLNWLDAQPACSVLYISQGSFLSFSDEQLDEIIAGVHDSGVRFLWVAREKTEWLKERCAGGFIVSWCDQLRVLSHGSIGGFWSHCGWNSTKEGAFSGAPFLTYPIGLDQITNSKQIVEDWEIGWSVKNKKGCDNNNSNNGIVRRREIAQLLRRFMDLKCDESEELRRKAKEIGEICRQSLQSGSAKHNLDKFIQDISTS